MFNKIKQVPAQYALNAVIYARYSSDKQTENSIDGQLRECKAFAKAHGFNVITHYIDRAASGTNDNRQEFQRMIEDAKEQKFAYIIVYRFDRFARNRFDSAIYKKKLEQNGVKVISASENIGTGDEGIILESIYEAMDEAYSRRLSKITKRGLEETARKGLWTGGQTPLGYVVVDKRLTIDEKNAPAIRFMFENFAQGINRQKIADELNAKGYRTKTGKLFNCQNFDLILNNPTYMGKRKYNDIIVECPAIISEELFNKVQELDAKLKKKMGRKPDGDFFPLSGKIFCGECGAVMTGDSGTGRSGGKYYYYSCSNKKKRRNNCKKKNEKKDFLEWYICEQTLLHILNDENINNVAELVVECQKKDKTNTEIAEIEKALAAIEREYDKLTDAFIESPKNPKIIQRINERSEALEKQREELEAQLSRAKLVKGIELTKEEIIQYLIAFKKGDLLDPAFRNKLIKTLVNRIYLFDDKIVVYYNIKGSQAISYIEMLEDIDNISQNKPYSKKVRIIKGKGSHKQKARPCVWLLFYRFQTLQGVNL